MGEANQKRRRHAKLLGFDQGCIYCAGHRPATQVDHMPPRMMFRTSQRPKGLEFPSCGPCNQGTSRLDVVAGFMARTFPGIESEGDSAEWEKLIGELNRVSPKILSEIWVPEKEMLQMMWSEGFFDQKLAAFRANGPILGAHMQAFGAKVGFALHYEATGTFVPSNGRVQVRWFTSAEVAADRMPSSLLSSVGVPRIMKQGKITSRGDFEYGWGDFAENPGTPIYYAKVREAFVVAAFVALSEERLLFPAGVLATFAPGDLAEDPYDRITEE